MKIDDLRHLIDLHIDKEEYTDAMESCIALAGEHAADMNFSDIFKKGLCHLKLDQDADAVGCFNKALEKEPDNVMALTNKGTCLFNMGRVEEAFKVFNQAIKLNPNVFPPWYYIGLYYMKIYTETGDLKAMEKMVNAYRQVVTMTPDIGGFLMHDPVKDMDYMIETFLMVHSDVREMSIDELTAI
jgi:tetratricopeptide (TPR) repeat protein